MPMLDRKRAWGLSPCPVGTHSHCAALGAQAPTRHWVRRQKHLDGKYCKPGKFQVSAFESWPVRSDPRTPVPTQPHLYRGPLGRSHPSLGLPSASCLGKIPQVLPAPKPYSAGRGCLPQGGDRGKNPATKVIPGGSSASHVLGLAERFLLLSPKSHNTPFLR